MLKKFCIVLFVSLILSNVSYSSSPSKKIQTRVLLGTSKSYKIFLKDNYVLVANDKKVSHKGNLDIKFHKQGILLNNRLLKAHSIEVLGSSYFSVNKRTYRGAFIIHREKNGLSLVNNVELEQYLLSVVPSEVYKSWDSETLKAQAIAARTYALYEIQRSRHNKNRKFDVFSDTRSQVYKGVQEEHRNTSRAVLATIGQVLTYKGALIKSYFSSSIGGMSAAGYEIGDNKPYLQPIKSYTSKQNPNNLWAIQVPLKKVQVQYKTSPIKSVDVVSRSTSGRINKINIKDSKGKITSVRGDHFRAKMGYSNMKSTRAQMGISKSGNLVIKGSGYGHGVGMGQWEAEELARRGANYPQILSHFYQGTSLKKIY